jgi:hypothetical protein
MLLDSWVAKQKFTQIRALISTLCIGEEKIGFDCVVVSFLPFGAYEIGRVAAKYEVVNIQNWGKKDSPVLTAWSL